MPKVKQIGKNKYCFASPLGEEIYLSNVDAVYQFHNGFAVYRVKNSKNNERKFGYIDEYGNKLPNTYDHADRFENHIARVRNGVLTNYIDESGRELFSWSYDYCDRFIYQTFIVKFKDDNGNAEVWGLIDMNENFIVYPTCKNKAEVISESKKRLIKKE